MFSWYIFVMGAILGVLQFGLGLWIGRVVYLRRKVSAFESVPKESASKETASIDITGDSKRLQAITGRVQSMVHRVSSDVNNHQVRIEQMTRELHTLQNRSVSVTEEVIWERLNQLMRMTGEFSDRLGDAESQIQVQAKQIDMLAESQNAALGEVTEEHESDSNSCSVPYFPDEDGLVPDETVASVASLGETHASEEGQEESPGDVDLVVESVRSRLNEIVHPAGKG